MNSAAVILLFSATFCSATILPERQHDLGCLMKCKEDVDELPQESLAHAISEKRANKSLYLLDVEPQVLCSQWASAKSCLQGCAASQQVLDGFGAFEYACSLTAEYLVSANCSEKHHEAFAAQCGSELDKAVEAAITQVTLYCERVDPVLGFRATERSVNLHCRAETALAECLDPLYRKTCGDRAADAKRTYAGLTLNVFKMLFGLIGGQRLSPECEVLITTAEADRMEKLGAQKNSTLGDF